MPNFGPISTPSCTSSPFNLPTSITSQSQQKTYVISDLGDSLRNIRIAKNDQKRLNNASIQETQRMKCVKKNTTKQKKICKCSRVEKLHIQTENKLKLRHLALEERQIAIKER